MKQLTPIDVRNILIWWIVLAFAALFLTGCSDSDPTAGDIHRQGKVPDGGMGQASGGN